MIEACDEYAALLGVAHLASQRVLGTVNRLASPPRRGGRHHRPGPSAVAYLRPEAFHTQVPVPRECVDDLLVRAWADVEAGLPLCDSWPCLRGRLHGALRHLLVDGLPYTLGVAVAVVDACVESAAVV